MRLYLQYMYVGGEQEPIHLMILAEVAAKYITADYAKRARSTFFLIPLFLKYSKASHMHISICMSAISNDLSHFSMQDCLQVCPAV